MSVSYSCLSIKSRPLLLTKSLTVDGAFEGYASLFNTLDDGGDIVESGAFAEGLQKRAKDGGVKMLYQHNPSDLIGKWTLLAEDTQGLFVRGKLNADIPKARQVYTMMKDGILDGLSIGYRPVKAFKDGQGHRHLVKVDLWEISLVTFPMNRLARVRV